MCQIKAQVHVYRKLLHNGEFKKISILTNKNLIFT